MRYGATCSHGTLAQYCRTCTTAAAHNEAIAATTAAGIPQFHGHPHQHPVGEGLSSSPSPAPRPVAPASASLASPQTHPAYGDVRNQYFASPQPSSATGAQDASPSRGSFRPEEPVAAEVTSTSPYAVAALGYFSPPLMRSAAAAPSPSSAAGDAPSEIGYAEYLHTLDGGSRGYKAEPHMAATARRPYDTSLLGAVSGDTMVASPLTGKRRGAKGKKGNRGAVKDAPPSTTGAGGVAGALYKAMKGMGTDEDTVFAQLKNVTSQPMWDAVRVAFAGDHSDFHDGDVLAALRSDLTDEEMTKAEAVLRGNGVDMHAAPGTGTVESDADPPQPEGGPAQLRDDAGESSAAAPALDEAEVAPQGGDGVDVSSLDGAALRTTGPDASYEEAARLAKEMMRVYGLYGTQAATPEEAADIAALIFHTAPQAGGAAMAAYNPNAVDRVPMEEVDPTSIQRRRERKRRGRSGVPEEHSPPPGVTPPADDADAPTADVGPPTAAGEAVEGPAGLEDIAGPAPAGTPAAKENSAILADTALLLDVLDLDAALGDPEADAARIKDGDAAVSKLKPVPEAYHIKNSPFLGNRTFVRIPQEETQGVTRQYVSVVRGPREQVFELEDEGRAVKRVAPDAHVEYPQDLLVHSPDVAGVGSRFTMLPVDVDCRVCGHPVERFFEEGPEEWYCASCGNQRRRQELLTKAEGMACCETPQRCQFFLCERCYNLPRKKNGYPVWIGPQHVLYSTPDGYWRIGPIGEEEPCFKTPPHRGNGPEVELTLTVDVNVDDRGAHESFRRSLCERFGIPSYMVPVQIKGGKGCYATVDVGPDDDVDELIAVHFASFVTFEMEVSYENPKGECYCGGFLDPEGWRVQPAGGIKCSMCSKLQYKARFAYCSNCGFAICSDCQRQPNELKLIEVSLTKPHGGLGGLFLLEKSNVIASVLPAPSSAAQNGMKKGMRIVAVNGQPTYDDQDVLHLYTLAKKRKSFDVEFTFSSRATTVMTSLYRHEGKPPQEVKEWMHQGYGREPNPKCYIEDARTALPVTEGYNLTDISKLPPADSVAAQANTAIVNDNDVVDIDDFLNEPDPDPEEEIKALYAEEREERKKKKKGGKKDGGGDGDGDAAAGDGGESKAKADDDGGGGAAKKGKKKPKKGGKSKGDGGGGDADGGGDTKDTKGAKDAKDATSAGDKKDNAKSDVKDDATKKDDAKKDDAKK